MPIFSGIKTRFSRSRKIAKASFKIVKQEKELILFSILSIVFSVLFLAAMIIPFITNSLFQNVTSLSTFSGIHYLLIFILYFGLAFIATFFNFCIVYTAAKAFSNENPTFWGTIKHSLSRISSIFIWSLVAATVGLIFRILESMAEKMKGGGKIFLLILNNVLGLLWGVATIFVIPVMVYIHLNLSSKSLIAFSV